MLEDVSSSAVVSPGEVVSRVANCDVGCLVPDRVECQSSSLRWRQNTHDVYGMHRGRAGAESRRPGQPLQRARATRGGTPAKRWRSPSWSPRPWPGRATFRRRFTDTRPRSVSWLIFVHLTSCSTQKCNCRLRVCFRVWPHGTYVGLSDVVPAYRPVWKGARTPQ